MNTLLDHSDTDALALLKRVHGAGDSLAAEYPLVFGHEFPGRIVALGEDGQARAACTVLVRDFVVPGAVVRGGLIGSVSTDPEWRGQGLGTRMLVEAEATLQLEGCAFALLWANDPTYYAERGYTEIGVEDDFLIEAVHLESLSDEGVRLFHSGSETDAKAIHALYESHPTRVRRTLAETKALLRCPGMQVLVRERDGEIVAYSCRGRGRDLVDAVHEWGGPADDVLALVRSHHLRRFPEGEGHLFLMAPVATELAQRLLELGVPTARGILGLGKLLDRQAAAELLTARLGEGGSASVVETPAGQRIRVTGPADEADLDDDGSLALLVATGEVRPHVEDFLARFGLTDAKLPLDPYAWGLDSI